MTNEYNAACDCGKTQFNIQGKPLMRGYCHCTICQEFNQAYCADITLFRDKDVTLPVDGQVVYKSYAKPEVVQRGKCASCGKPAVEYAKMGPLGRVIIVPSNNIRDAALLPEPEMHVFYHRRKADAQDSLPKYNGYLKSQLAFMGKLLKRLASS